VTVAVETRGLAKHFGAVKAVDGIDLDVASGEVFGFLGPNGAGKTTTIRLLLGLLRPTAGSMTVLGADPLDPESRRRIAYLPGDLQLDPKMTGWEHLRLYGELRDGLDETRARDLCDALDLDPSRPCGELSKGNRQKVGIVQVFMFDADLLVLDEPTSGLDPLQQQLFNGLLHEAKLRGAATFLSSHVLPEVERVADRVGIIRAGKLVKVATIDELRRSVRQRLTITLDAPVAADLSAIDGVVESSVDGTSVHVLLTGALQPVLDALSGAEIVRISSHDDDLDDLFLEFYR
jgi:ABC-2 type transport system ATP-binding protein